MQRKFFREMNIFFSWTMRANYSHLCDRQCRRTDLAKIKLTVGGENIHALSSLPIYNSRMPPNNPIIDYFLYFLLYL